MNELPTELSEPRQFPSLSPPITIAIGGSGCTSTLQGGEKSF